MLCRLEQSYEQLQKEVNRLTDIAYYSTVDQLPRTDKVLVNELCRDIAGGREVEVLYGSDIPDYYAISTNRAALERVLEILLGGFIYIDPDYKNGRRVIFSIAI